MRHPLVAPSQVRKGLPRPALHQHQVLLFQNCLNPSSQTVGTQECLGGRADPAHLLLQPGPWLGATQVALLPASCPIHSSQGCVREWEDSQGSLSGSPGGRWRGWGACERCRGR